MIQLTAVAKVWYACTLSEKDEKCVRDYMKKNDVELLDAVRDLYAENEIEIYQESEESDFLTLEIEDAEEEEE